MTRFVAFAVLPVVLFASAATAQIGGAIFPAPERLIEGPGIIAAPPPPTWTGSFTLGLRDRADLGDGGNDLILQLDGPVAMALAPIGTAAISFAGGARRGIAGCLAAAYSSAPVPLNFLAVGMYMCVVTTSDNFAEIEVTALGPVVRTLTARYATWD